MQDEEILVIDKNKMSVDFEYTACMISRKSIFKIYAVRFVILRSKATKNLYIRDAFVIKILRLRSG